MEEANIINCALFIYFDTSNKVISPQPTRFWIINKEIHKYISKLEEIGYIGLWENLISENQELFNYFVQLHSQEIELRKIFLRKHDNIPFYIKKKFLSTGIGGIEYYDKKPFKVKCLHLWTAYHLGNEKFKNPIGEFVIHSIKRLHQNL